MALAKLKYLTENEVLDISAPILQAAFKDYGFDLARTTVEETEDHYGDSIFRLEAGVVSVVPARALIDAMHYIHVALRKRGDNRSVILSTKRPLSDDDKPDEIEE